MADKSDKIKKNYQEALDAANKLVDKTKEQKEAMDDAMSVVDDLTTSFLKMSRSDFFKEVKKTPQDLAESAKKVKEIQRELKGADAILANDFKKSFSDLLDNFDGFKSKMKGLKFDVDLGAVIENFDGFTKNQIDVLKNKMSDLRKEGGLLHNVKDDEKAIQLMINNFDKLKDGLDGINAKQLQGMLSNYRELAYEGMNVSDAFGKDYAETLELLSANFDKNIVQDFIKYGKDVEGFIEKHKDKALEFISVLSDQNPELQKSLQIHNDITKQLEYQLEVEKKQTKQIATLNQGLKKISKEMFSGLSGFLTSYDNAISKAQRETGIMFKENTMAMADLTSHNAAFGMSVEETTQMMGQLSDKMQTTDFGVLSKAAKDFASISGALGVSSGEITEIAGEMMRFGASSEQVKEAFEDTNVLAKKLGVSSRNVVKQIERNITKMREFGFTGGIKSLQKMAAEAERLGIQVDEIFNVAKRARSIEGAMEMAAELQLAGGSFSQMNPMDLLSAARKGPEELGKILTKMGGDIGKFNKETGQYEFDPVDVDRLNIVAEATGMSLDALQKTISKNAEDNKKIELLPTSMFEMGKMSEDQKKLLTSLTEIDKNGTIKFKGDSKTLSMLKEAKINTDDLSSLTADQMSEYQKIVESNARDLEAQNARNASLAEAWDRLKNSLMAVFAVFEPVLVFLADTIGKLAQILGESGPWGKGIAAFVVAAPLLVGGLMGFVNTFGGLVGSFAKNISMLSGGKLKLPGFGGGGGVGGGSGPMENVANMDKKLPASANSGGFLGSLAAGIKSFGAVSLKDIGKLALSLTTIGGALVGFSYAMVEMGGEATMGQMITMGASLVLLGGSIVLLSKFSKGIDTKGLLTMSVAMTIVGASLIPFAYAANMLNDVDWTTTIASLGLLSLATIALAGVGAVLLGSGIGIAGVYAMAGAMLAVSGSLFVFASSAKILSEIDWGNFGSMGPALLSAVPGLLGFSLAAMTFANPLTLVGIIAMTGSLLGLSAVLTPLAMALTESSSAFASFASNMGLLGEAVAKFDIDKFERIAGASKNMSESSTESTVGGILGSIFGSGENKATNQPSSTQTVVHEHVIKLTLEGRELNRIIIRDNQLLS